MTQTQIDIITASDIAQASANRCEDRKRFGMYAEKADALVDRCVDAIVMVRAQGGPSSNLLDQSVGNMVAEVQGRVLDVAAHTWSFDFDGKEVGDTVVREQIAYELILRAVSVNPTPDPLGKFDPFDGLV